MFHNISDSAEIIERAQQDRRVQKRREQLITVITLYIPVRKQRIGDYAKARSILLCTHLA